MKLNLINSLSYFALGKGHERTVKAKKNIVYSFGLQGVSIVVGLLYVPLLLDYLDAERYGIWLTLSSILGWFEFFDIGLGNGLRNRFTEALARNDHALARIYVSTTYALLTIIFSVVLLVFFIVNPFLNWTGILNTSTVPENELTLLALIVFTFFILRFIFKLIGTILMADQRPAISNAFGPIGSVITLLVVLILLRTTSEGSLIVLGSLLSIIPVLVLIIASFILFRGRYKIYSPSLKHVNFKYTSAIMKLGSRFFLIHVASVILFTTSNFIITQIRGPEDVTVYNIAYKYFSIPVMVFSIIMTPVWSAVTDAYVKNDFAWLKNTIKRLNQISVLFVAGILFMLIISGFVYRIWVGERVEIPLVLTVMMTLFAAINVTLSPFTHFINGCGKLRLSTLVVYAQMILFIPLAIILTRSSLGVAGVMLATCIINSLGFFFEPIQVFKLINRKADGIWNK